MSASAPSRYELPFSPPTTAALETFAISIVMYGWWVFADMLLSDDYSFYMRDPDFAMMTNEFFRPGYELASDWMASWAISSPNAVYWMKALHLLFAAGFFAVVAGFFARLTGSVFAGLAVGLLVATNPGAQINAVWLCITPQWVLFFISAIMFAALHQMLPGKDRGTLLVAVGLSAILLLAMMLVYQLPPFYLLGMLAAYVILSRENWSQIQAHGIIILIVIAIGGGIYAAALKIGISSGEVTGRAASAMNLQVLMDRISDLQLTSGMYWLNLFLPPKTTAALVMLTILCGAILDVTMGPDSSDRAKRWGAAIALTFAALIAPGLINPFASARLYTPGAIGVAALLVAAVWTMIRHANPRWKKTWRNLSAAGLVIVVMGSSAATMIGFGQAQHAELQYIRAQLGWQDLSKITRIHLVPPDPGPHWTQTISDSRDDMYGLRLSTYHDWTYEGIVRFAIRNVDPQMRIDVTFGPPLAEVPANVAVIDMRPISASLYRIPY